MAFVATSLCIAFNQSSPICSLVAFRFELNSAFPDLTAELLLRPDPRANSLPTSSRSCDCSTPSSSGSSFTTASCLPDNPQISRDLVACDDSCAAPNSICTASLCDARSTPVTRHELFDTSLDDIRELSTAVHRRQQLMHLYSFASLLNCSSPTELLDVQKGISVSGEKTQSFRLSKDTHHLYSSLQLKNQVPATFYMHQPNSDSVHHMTIL